MVYLWIGQNSQVQKCGKKPHEMIDGLHVTYYWGTKLLFGDQIYWGTKRKSGNKEVDKLREILTVNENNKTANNTAHALNCKVLLSLPFNMT